MSKVKHSPTQKKRSQHRTIKIKSLLDRVERGLLSINAINGTKGRVLTTLDPNHDCFHSKGKYLYFGTPLSQLKKYREDARPKLGKAEIPVGETINASRDRYNVKDPFVVVEVITINDNQLQKFGVKTIQQLEEKIRKELKFTPDENFDGDEFWKGRGIVELIDEINSFIFEGKQKETFEPRIPQKRAIEKMIDAFTKGMYKEFLFGAIMRFGKNFAFLYAIVEILKNNPNARILVWTNKPGVFNTLEKDVNGHIKFVDYTYISIKDSKDVKVLPNKCIVTASKQLLENSKNEDTMLFIEEQEWDFIVIDESHTGIETDRGQKFLNKFKNTRKIFISGTPQKQLGKIQFNDQNTFIYDEICQKKDKELGIWLDAIILNTHLIKLSPNSVEQYKNCVSDETGYFTFTKFFSNKKGVGLTYEQSVLKFFMDFFGYNKLDDSYNYFGKHKNVAILVPSGVDGIKELKKILENSIFGQDYVIVAATGKEFKRNQLKNAFLSGKKTITILSDMLIEGETVPEWDCTINMSDGVSIFKYLQFAFRSTNPNKDNLNKNAFFYDMNPQRHFIIQNERMRLNGLKGVEREKSLRDWYKNFKIMISENVEGMVEVNFDALKKDSYRLGNMMRSINSLLSWENINLIEFEKDLKGVEKQNSNNVSSVFNDNGIGGGKNSKVTKGEMTQENLSEKELKDIQDRWNSIMSRVPYVLYQEKCETLSSLLINFQNIDGMFDGAFGISQKVFEKYWNNENFIDKSELDFYFKNYSESI